MKSAHILRRQYLNLVDAFSGEKNNFDLKAIRRIFPKKCQLRLFI